MPNSAVLRVLDTVFMLVSDKPDDVLGTIYSRCQRIAVPPIDKRDMEQALRERYSVADEDVAYLVKNAMGSWGRMLGLLKETEEAATAGSSTAFIMLLIVARWTMVIFSI